MLEQDSGSPFEIRTISSINLATKDFPTNNRLSDSIRECVNWEMNPIDSE
jgi:hypothetical protein